MQAQDPHILAAMDGKEASSLDKDPILSANRKEPTAFFQVIFGLVYEALTTSSADATSSSNRQYAVISALQALKCLVRPEYSGNALTEPTIFDEFMSLCYRMGMTEAPAIQVHLVEMLAVFASAQSSIVADSLTLTSPPAHCLRICSNILKQATLSRVSVARKWFNLPFVSSAIIYLLHTYFEEGQLPDRIAIILTSITAFSSIAASIASSQREDVRGVAILLYTGIHVLLTICDYSSIHDLGLLKDETTEIDFVGPTLPALKTLLDLPVPNPDDKERYGRLVNALLSTCLLNIDSMRCAFILFVLPRAHIF